MTIPPRAARLALALATPAAVVITASLLSGVAATTEGCAGAEIRPAGSLLRAPSAEGLEIGRVARVRAESFSTLASTAGLFGNLSATAATRGEASALDELLGHGGQASDVPYFGAYNGLCPPDMASIDDRFCVDRYEASLVEVLSDGTERPFSPYESVRGQVVRAISEPGVYPQGYVSEVQAIQACSLSGKRLCRAKEWRQACMGPEHKRYGYSDNGEAGRCNDHGRSPMQALYAGENLAKRDKWDWERMNRPELNQLEGTLAHTGEHDGCTNGYGVYDMVGNLHEWVDDPNGTFQGGYYQDTTLNGEGCQYVTTAHEARYHDYSTGFRCCSDVAP